MSNTTAPSERPAPSAHMLAGNKGFGIGTENLDEALAAYDEEAIELLRWWFDTAKDHSWTLGDLSKRVGVSTTSLSRVYRGVYGADASNIIRSMRDARELFGEAVENPDFILTSLARRMFAIFDKTRALRNVTILWGEKGIGKSTIEQEYTRRNNHGRTYYFRCPGYGVTRTQFVRELATAMKIAVKGSHDVMRHKVGRYLARGNRLLIVDEFHEIFRTCHKKEIVRICEWIRQLYDEHGMGLAITGTELVRKEFFEGEHAEVLDQLVDRGTIQIPLPSKPTKKDVVAFLEHYGLGYPEAGGEALAILNDLLAAYGLRKLTLHLRDGAALANRKGEAYAWSHFTDAFEAIRKLSL